MTILYLVRHGETEWNAKNKIQGNMDIELNDKGLKQAEFVADRLSNENIDIIYSSRLKRAKTTAQIIADGMQLSVNELDEFREIGLGPWEGLTMNEINEKYTEHYKFYREKPSNFNMPGAETFLQVTERFCSAINTIINQNEDKKIVVVSHGAAIKAAIISILGMDIDYYNKFRVDNASISTLYFSDKYHGGVVVNSL
ncbi:MAG TPA: histidine phosphatase family protein, partial [Patescibacteria group bacterium]|nr:histidine phosphatase family protein [Patescibacteria group bacterium]